MNTSILGPIVTVDQRMANVLLSAATMPPSSNSVAAHFGGARRAEMTKDRTQPSTAEVFWLGLMFGGHLALSLHSSNEPYELSQSPAGFT